jgi:hypothetical protein
MVWLNRHDVHRAVSRFTEDEDLRARLRRALELPRMLARGWCTAYADEFRGFDTKFSAFLRAME